MFGPGHQLRVSMMKSSAPVRGSRRVCSGDTYDCDRNMIKVATVTLIIFRLFIIPPMIFICRPVHPEERFVWVRCKWWGGALCSSWHDVHEESNSGVVFICCVTLLTVNTGDPSTSPGPHVWPVSMSHLSAVIIGVQRGKLTHPLCTARRDVLIYIRREERELRGGAAVIQTPLSSRWSGTESAATRLDYIQSWVH